MLMVLRDDDGSVLEFDELGEGKLRIRLQDGLSGRVGETTSTYDSYPSVMTVMVHCHELIAQLRPTAPIPEVESDSSPS